MRARAGTHLPAVEGEQEADGWEMAAARLTRCAIPYRLLSTACVVTQYLASMFAFSHCGREDGSFR